MSDVQIGQACDTLHVDVYKCICLKSNNEKITSPKHRYITLFLDYKCLLISLQTLKRAIIVYCGVILKLHTLSA